MAELLSSAEYNTVSMKNYFFTKKGKLAALLVLLVSGLSFVSYSPVEKRDAKPDETKGIIVKGAEKSGYSESNLNSF